MYVCPNNLDFSLIIWIFFLITGYSYSVHDAVRDVFVIGRPYLGKPSDMWALGVLLYTMLYGQFPFYDNTPHELFRKIKAVEYTIPEYVTFCIFTF